MNRVTLTPAQLDAALGPAPPCWWCGAPTDRASFAVGDRVFCSGKCARRCLETYPVRPVPLQLAGLAEVARLRSAK